MPGRFLAQQRNVKPVRMAHPDRRWLLLPGAC